MYWTMIGVYQIGATFGVFALGALIGLSMRWWLRPTWWHDVARWKLLALFGMLCAIAAANAVAQGMGWDYVK